MTDLPGGGSTTGVPGTAVGIAAAVRTGRWRAVDVLREHLDRHRHTASRLNALVQLRAAAAEDAAAVDAAVSRGAAAGLALAGVPVSVKECFGIRGLKTTLGIEARVPLVDDHDADLVSRLRSSGAVVVGKANVPQAMYLHETDNPVWGRTVHPRDRGRGPGGSSGGDAALVAAGVVPIGVGNDLAGSLRQPAHACGVATIMPRSTVLGEGGAFDTMPGLKAVRARAGFIARTVDDLAVALAATAGDACVQSSTAAPRRVGWWIETGPIPAAPGVRRAVEEAVRRLEAHGIETTLVRQDVVTESAWLLLGIVAADGGDDVRRLFAGRRPMRGVATLLGMAGLAPRWRAAVAAVLRSLGRRIEAEGLTRTGRRSAAGLADLLAAREALAVRFATAVAGCDAVVCPVSALPALRHGSAARLVLAAAPCLLANLLDLPAGSVPVATVRPDEQGGRGWSFDPVLRAAAMTNRGSGGLPLGVQVVGCPGRSEATVLEVMRLIGPG